MTRFFAIAAALLPLLASADISYEELDNLAAAVQPQVVECRRWFHENPELSNREVETSARVAEILEGMGLEVETGIARTGVVAMLRGGRPGPLVAIRADMDGLPVAEETGLDFASVKTSVYNGQETGVMHACGHDSHMAMALGAAKVLSEVRDELPGSVMFIFQPASPERPCSGRGSRKASERCNLARKKSTGCGACCELRPKAPTAR
jgi:metal-dependent amidase/aminoacylase/carboxypeptidase family protein